MQKYCQNPLCERASATEVCVSVEGRSEETRTLCAACKVAFDWGVQHGRMASKSKNVWVLAVTYKGTTVHTKAVSSMAKAVKALAEYLRAENGYAGPAELSDLCNWMAKHDERLTANIIHASLDLS